MHSKLPAVVGCLAVISGIRFYKGSQTVKIIVSPLMKPTDFENSSRKFHIPLPFPVEIFL